MPLSSLSRILVVCLSTLLFSGILFPQTCPAEGPPPSAAAGERVSLGPYVEYLLDPGGKLGIAQIVAGDYSGRFQENKAEVLRLGVRRSVVWVRFKLEPAVLPKTAPGEPLVLSVEKALLASARLYAELPGSGGPAWQEIPMSQGPWVQQPPVHSNAYVFRLAPDIVPGSYLYLRLNGPGITYSIPLALWPANTYQAMQRDMGMLLGALYGVIIAMCLYNFFIFITLRDKVYFYYIIWMLGAVAWMAAYNGHVSAYLPVSSAVGVGIYYMSLCVSIVFALLFTKSFVNTRKYTPWLDKILTFLYLPTAALAVVTLTGYHTYSIYLAHFMARAGAPIIVIAAIRCWIKGFKPARYVVLAWSMSVVGIVVLSLSISGVLPYTLITFNGWSIGTALESVLLAFALSDRIKSLQDEKEHLQRSQYHLEELSITDDLTKLYNSRYFFQQLERLAPKSGKAGGPISCIMLDVDDFKQINDTYGHPEGDKVLRQLGSVIRSCIRTSDLGCRYGGEEFAVLLPGSEAPAALAVAERIRTTFGEQVFQPGAEVELKVTVSAGVAQIGQGEDGRQMVKRADECLYRAKRKGKDRTETTAALG